MNFEPLHTRQKKALICGTSGFIGGHLFRKLKADGYKVRGISRSRLVDPGYDPDDWRIGDLRDTAFCESAIDQHFDEIYQFAAEAGGAGYIFSGANDYQIMSSSVVVTRNVLDRAIETGASRFFYPSSVCVYGHRETQDNQYPTFKEDDSKTSIPSSAYGWEKLFSEQLVQSAMKNHDIDIRIGRFFNVFGPGSPWHGGREQVPAALCRKTAMAENNSSIKIWGDGKQYRSFLYVDECVKGIQKLMASSYNGPLNIGSGVATKINDLAEQIIDISGKTLEITHTAGHEGARYRCSDNSLITQVLNWEPDSALTSGLTATYHSIQAKVHANKNLDAQEQKLAI